MSISVLHNREFPLVNVSENVRFVLVYKGLPINPHWREIINFAISFLYLPFVLTTPVFILRLSTCYRQIWIIHNVIPHKLPPRRYESDNRRYDAIHASQTLSSASFQYLLWSNALSERTNSTFQYNNIRHFQTKPTWQIIKTQNVTCRSNAMRVSNAPNCFPNVDKQMTTNGDGFFFRIFKFERRRMAVSVEWDLKGCWRITSDLDPRGMLIVWWRMRRRLMMETIVLWQQKVKCFQTYDRRLRWIMGFDIILIYTSKFRYSHSYIDDRHASIQ